MITLTAFATAASLGLAIVAQDRVALRAGPRESAPAHAVLWQGEAVEVRGERLDYVQVYDYRRERAGFMHASRLRKVALQPTEAPELLGVVRFLRDAPGSEALGIGFAAAYLRAAPAEDVNGANGVEALDALGGFAERLARRATLGTGSQELLSAHLDVAARYGVKFTAHESGGRVHVCYDGDAYKRVLGMKANPEQRARAVLALTRAECAPGELEPTARRAFDEWRSEVLDTVEAPKLPPYLRNRILMRRAGVWSGLAYQFARHGGPAELAANRALAELASVEKGELTDEDRRTYAEAAMRVGASRWAIELVPASGARIQVVTVRGMAGETCIHLVEAKGDPKNPLAKRCTYGVVWTASASLNREGNALALAVQPVEGWRELWVFRKTPKGWFVRVLPPASTPPGVGYAEFAGWIPGGTQMLVARESAAEGRYRRNFEVRRIDTLGVVREAGAPAMLNAFQRWQDPAWKRTTLSMR